MTPKKKATAEAKARVMEIVRAEECEAGHLFSGGQGLSMFIMLLIRLPKYKRPVKIHAYGNGVRDIELAQRFRAEFGDGFVGMQTRLD